MRAFFCKPLGGEWHIATREDGGKHTHFLTVLNTPVNANDAVMLDQVKAKNPTDVEHLTYTELMQ